MFKENSVKVKCSTAAQGKSAQSGLLRRRGISILGVFSIAIVSLGLLLGTAQGSPLHSARNMKVWTGDLARLPLSFEANRGQTNSHVKFLARGTNYTLFLTEQGAVLSLRSTKSGLAGKHTSAATVVRLRLLGSSSNARVTGRSLLPGYSNYFLGNNPKNWHTRIPNYQRVQYNQIYPGISLAYYGRQGQIENDFVLSPGANPGLIHVGLQGVENVRLNRSGDLVLKVAGGELYLRQPRAYQGSGTARKSVPVHYVLQGAKQVGFGLGAYDHHQSLVIDPVLAYSTYLGGTSGDIGYGIAVDSSGDAYVTGISHSADFPGSQSGSYGGQGDAFVVKIDPTGTAGSSTTPQLVYSTYLGGSGTDSGNAIAVSSTGDAFVTGSTNSTDFPTTSGVFQSGYGGSGDAFVAQVDSTGASLVYSSYLGGNGVDSGLGIAVDSSGNAYVTGSTQSSTFKTVNAEQTVNAGSSDAFVAEVNFAGSQLLYSTYLGGSQADVGQSIKVDGSGNVFVAGYTFSTDFPVVNPVQGSNAGTENAFVTELNPANAPGSQITFSTYFGGSGQAQAFGLALGSSGNVYIAGSSQSTDFPTTTGAYQQTNTSGYSDAFVVELNPLSTTPIYSTLLGGSGVDQAKAIAVDSSGDAFITGFTTSSDFPAPNAIQAVLGISGGSGCGASACADAFVSEINPTGTGLVQSTYLGGSGADFGQAIALGPTGIPYVTGSTSSSNFPATAGALQANLNGVAGNAFLAEIKPDNAPGISIVPQLLDFGNQTQNVRSAAKDVVVTNEGTAALTISSITFTETDSTGATNDFAESDNCVGTVSASGGTCTIHITFDPSTVQAETGYFSIADNAANSPQVIDVKGQGVTAATAVTVTPSSLSFGDVTVGDTSSAKTVTITNTGTQTLNITGIAATGDFAQTNTCGSFLNVLTVGQSCTVSVTFSPTVTGARNGALSISDNATGSPQSVALSGAGVAVFKMSASKPNVTTVIGSSSATFTISASASTSFSGSITLACPSTLTCSFNPATILVGQTSTLTISNLTTSMPNPLAFAVAGTSGSQSAQVALNLIFADYALSTTPSLNTITAGNAATYSISVNPLNGFNQQVQLACGNGVPPGATCTFSKSSVTPNGGASTVSLTIQTTKNADTPPPPLIPPGAIPPLMAALLVLILAGSFIFMRHRRRYPYLAGKRWVCVQVCALSLLILGEVFLGACRSNPTTTGSTTGNYSITINGTLGSNSSVVRSTIVNLAITQ